MMAIAHPCPVPLPPSPHRLPHPFPTCSPQPDPMSRKPSVLSPQQGPLATPLQPPPAFPICTASLVSLPCRTDFSFLGTLAFFFSRSSISPPSALFRGCISMATAPSCFLAAHRRTAQPKLGPSGWGDSYKGLSYGKACHSIKEDIGFRGFLLFLSATLHGGYLVSHLCPWQPSPSQVGQRWFSQALTEEGRTYRSTSNWDTQTGQQVLEYPKSQYLRAEAWGLRNVPEP